MYYYIGSKIPVRLDNSPKKVASDASSPATATTTTTTTTAPSTSSETSKKLNGGGSSTESPETNSKSDKKVTTTTSPKKSSKPWLSPKMFRAKKESRSKSVDHPKAGIKPVQTTGRKNDFLMEEDDVGETTASSTSDSEVVVVVNDVRRSKVDKSKNDKTRRNAKKEVAGVGEEERVRTFFDHFFEANFLF